MVHWVEKYNGDHKSINRQAKQLTLREVQVNAMRTYVYPLTKVYASIPKEKIYTYIDPWKPEKHDHREMYHKWIISMMISRRLENIMTRSSWKSLMI